MEEARRRRLERGDDPLEDATTKVVANTAKLARTMTMAVAAPVVAVLEDEQVQVRPRVQGVCQAVCTSPDCT